MGRSREEPKGTMMPARRTLRFLRERRPRLSPRTILSALAGLILLAGAIWVVASHGEALDAALRNARSASPLLVLLAIALPMANWLIISASFRVLYLPDARVPMGEMNAMVGGAWLMNYLPLRPGLVARVAYHKRRHGISIRRSVRVFIVNSILSSVSMALCGAIVLAMPASLPPALTLSLLVLPIVLAPALAPILRDRFALLPLAFALRHADFVVWVARYVVVFAIIGVPISPRESVAIAVVSQVVLLVPIAGNGLGLREWAIALLAGILPTFAAQDATATGLAGDLVHRGMEVVAALLVGIPSLLWLSARLRSAPERPGAVPAHSDNAGPAP